MERISVRNLVEFILRTGDLNASAGGSRDSEAMQEGIRVHKAIQRKMGKYYTPEVALKMNIETSYDGTNVEIVVEGRADGIFEAPEGVTIHEIKSMYQEVTRLEEVIEIHKYQAMCYAAIYSMQEGCEEIGVKFTYCQIETMIQKNFDLSYSREELSNWFMKVVEEYAKWVVWSQRWVSKRNESIKEMKFPFEYRNGQFDLVKGVYLSILRKKKLFLQAPTGVGKTISTVFPAVTAMGEGITDKIFYLTAKTITRTVASETVRCICNEGVSLKSVVITAKDKVCIFDHADCNPIICERAKGHFDRINDALYDVISNKDELTREDIEMFAEKHRVCPYELSLDISNWSDVIICDYNYVFDPTACLKRYFSENSKGDYTFLIDEAHNLIDRARSMYSAVLYKADIMAVKRAVESHDAKLFRSLEAINKTLLNYKRQCDEFEVWDSVGGLVLQIMRAVTYLDEFLKDYVPRIPNFEFKEVLLNLFFDLNFFIYIHDCLDDKYRIYTDYNEKGEFRITLECMDPSTNLSTYLQKGRSAIFFSATLLPVKYYMEQYGASDEDYAVYAESSFSAEQQLILVAGDVSSKYTRRNKDEYKRICEYLISFVQGKTGNYLIFFPSYKMMTDVLKEMPDECFDYIVQQTNMNEEDREDFLSYFQEEEQDTRVGFCVMGGVFGEGIDLKEDMLIGVAIVGTGLPMMGNERELYRDYFDKCGGKGFEYAYLYPGMNKVLQAAGRVIRTAKDKGVILLLDERFHQRQYSSLFPREWSNIRYINRNTMKKELNTFWLGEREGG